MGEYSRICAQINLDHFEHNMDEIERLISPGTKICAVIKTDGYGHGAVPLARILENRDSVWGYSVATVEEAMILKESGMKKPVLILGYVFEEDLETVIQHEIRPTVFSLESAKELSDIAQKLQKTVHIHIKIDTGMGRIGFSCADETVETILKISQMPNLDIEGIFSHFAMADAADKTFSRKQAETFFDILSLLEENNIKIPMRHISNSAGIIDLPEYNLDLVRAGIILYGLWPSDEVKKDRIDLKPLMSLTSHVIHVKTLDEGAPISYGATYRVRGSETIATIPAGYGDGYPRSLSNAGYVLIHGRRAPICGRICMDQFMVNVTDIEDVKPGDEVTLIGKDGDEEITIEQLAEISGRFNYEFACDIGKRVPRIYIRDGSST